MIVFNAIISGIIILYTVHFTFVSLINAIYIIICFILFYAALVFLPILGAEQILRFLNHMYYLASISHKSIMRMEYFARLWFFTKKSLWLTLFFLLFIATVGFGSVYSFYKSESLLRFSVLLLFIVVMCFATGCISCSLY